MIATLFIRDPLHALVEQVEKIPVIDIITTPSNVKVYSHPIKSVIGPMR